MDIWNGISFWITIMTSQNATKGDFTDVFIDHNGPGSDQKALYLSHEDYIITERKKTFCMSNTNRLKLHILVSIFTPTWF